MGRSDESFDRRKFAQEFTRRSRANIPEMLAQPYPQNPGANTLVAFTGPPGAGKSSIIERFGLRRANAGRRVSVIAIDPASPISGGSILGDRIRMSSLASHPRAMVRSVSSRGATDGLCPNITGLIDLTRAAGFEDLIIETVGVGQSAHAIREAVHTLILVLLPESGDTVQAMKAGILELADIFIVHKSDLAGAARLLQEIRSVVEMRRYEPSGWKPEVLAMSSLSEAIGYDALDAAVARHALWRERTSSPEAFEARLRKMHLHQVLTQALETALAQRAAELGRGPLRSEFAAILSDLQQLHQ